MKKMPTKECGIKKSFEFFAQVRELLASQAAVRTPSDRVERRLSEIGLHAKRVEIGSRASNVSQYNRRVEEFALQIARNHVAIRRMPHVKNEHVEAVESLRVTLECAAFGVPYLFD